MESYHSAIKVSEVKRQELSVIACFLWLSLETLFHFFQFNFGTRMIRWLKIAVSLTYWSLSKQMWNTACRYGFCVMTVGPQMKSSTMWLHTSAQVVTPTTPDSLGALPVQHLPDSCSHQSMFPTYILLPLPGGSSLWFYGEKLCNLSHYRIYVEGSKMHRVKSQH
jgi:hypothetical protein